jgi:hypothetical protein
MTTLPQVADSDSPDDSTRQISTANGINKIINSYIILADQKASFLIAAGVAAPSLLLTALPQGMVFAAVVYLASTALFILSVILSMATIIPRIPMEGNGSVFWGDIATCGDLKTYQKRFDDSYENGKLQSEYVTLNYYSARILRSKFRCLRFSIIAFVIGSILGTVSTIMSRL